MARPRAACLRLSSYLEPPPGAKNQISWQQLATLSDSDEEITWAEVFAVELTDTDDEHRRAWLSAARGAFEDGPSEDGPSEGGPSEEASAVRPAARAEPTRSLRRTARRRRRTDKPLAQASSHGGSSPAPSIASATNVQPLDDLKHPRDC